MQGNPASLRLMFSLRAISKEGFSRCPLGKSQPSSWHARRLLNHAIDKLLLNPRSVVSR